MKPQRIQLSRRKGWRMPPNTVKVTRPGIWGNPYVVGESGPAEECVERFRKMLAGNLWTPPTITTIQEQLRGKNLACWCKIGAPCHGDVLLRVANSSFSEARNFIRGEFKREEGR